MKKVQSKENPEITGTLKVLTRHDNIIDQIIVEQGYTKFYYDNLTDLYDNWKDYEGPKEGPKESALDLMILTLANFIENEPDEDKVDLEDCKRMLEKLKAWTRLEKKGFEFEGIKQDYTRFNQQEPMRTGRKYLQFNKSEDKEWLKENWKDLYLLFGGKE